MWIFFGPAKLIATWPHAGFALGAALIAAELWLYQTRGVAFSLAFFREAAVFAGLLWIIFNAYEWQIAATAFAKTPIRYDLLVLVPILYVMTAVAVLMLKRQLAQKRAEKRQ
ncbi:MAG: hypothetical protein JNJ55_08195 [Betaproteobacteria bacterium]|nr:hypothetical protein [Betaproteobacteria bacterium]